MPATLREVARRAGVSVSTVSRVIRDADYIAGSTRQKVLESIDELQYRPSNIARHLRYGRTYLVGFVMGDIANPFFSDAVKGAEQYLRDLNDNNFELVLSNTDNQPDSEIKAIELMLDKHAEAIILASTATPGCLKLVRKVVEETHVPIISIDNQLGGYETGLVTAENQVGAYQITAHLLKHGYNRLGIIAGPGYESHVAERLEGCRQAVAESGLDWEDQLVAYGHWRVEDGYQITTQWLEAKQVPDAIFALNNFMCMGALSALIAHNLAVPEDIALASFDEIEFGHLLRPRLTALDYSFLKIGEEAIRLALKAIQGGENHNDRVTVRLPVRMTVRESCGCKE